MTAGAAEGVGRVGVSSPPLLLWGTLGPCLEEEAPLPLRMWIPEVL